MKEIEKPIDRLIHDLRERAKELNCLYEVQEILNNPDIPNETVCAQIIEVLPPGWQYPDICEAEIIYQGKSYHTGNYILTPWVQTADILVQDEVIGRISVCYTEDCPIADEGPFLKEERKLINTIADQFGFFVLHQQLRQVFEEQSQPGEEEKSPWRVVLDMLERTDPELLVRISRKMINFLGLGGIKQAESLLDHLFTMGQSVEVSDDNVPSMRKPFENLLGLSQEVFTLANRYLTQDAILMNIQNWIKEDRSSFLIDVLVNPGSSLAEISTAIERYHLLASQGLELTSPREKWFRISLIRRILGDQLKFIDVAQDYLNIENFSNFMHRIIYPVSSHGKLGGKSSGLFLATQILKKELRSADPDEEIKTPKTWYLTSDSIFYFISYNNLEDFIEQKYKDIVQIRQEYPFIVHLFKSSRLPPEIIKGLSLALDDFADIPLIVRSSSLLEDRIGTSFAGKYKSLFIANKGSKDERLEDLMDAIKEVYASMFGPDPIEYRIEHELVDDHEEMGILIQEVVGTHIGPYYLPAFAGVAFNNNEFLWSSRIKRKDGLVRLVPGLGTRAVDRMSNDFPVLISPGNPLLRVNATVEETIRYSPQKIDVINLETRNFETVDIQMLLKQYRKEYPLIHQLVSVVEAGHIRRPSRIGLELDKNDFVVTFEGLVTRTSFIQQINTILRTLQSAFNYPVDIEFAHDGTSFYLLQCRMQSYREDSAPAVIPMNLQENNILFSANRYVTNGSIADITHIVYVSPQKYLEIDNHQDLINVGKAIGKINQLLPKRQFVLIGPGRWGSRGDIKLGVNVTYSDINNTCLLVEISQKHGDFNPEPSFGTHFFQDLVEASIRYLPIYIGEPQVLFNESFFISQHNLLEELVPEFAYLSSVIHIIDVPASTGGKVLQVLMNADQEKALAIITPLGENPVISSGYVNPLEITSVEMHWKWRMNMAEVIAANLDPLRFGLKSCYVFGSVQNATAGPASDIDLLLHFSGTDNQRKELLAWLEGWNLSLCQTNFIRTGVRTKKLLDVHLVTDAEVDQKYSFAAKISATDNPARPLRMKTGTD